MNPGMQTKTRTLLLLRRPVVDAGARPMTTFTKFRQRKPVFPWGSLPVACLLVIGETQRWRAGEQDRCVDRLGGWELRG